jgi:hypothetical protein
VKGFRRVEADELIKLVVEELNVELTRNRYGQVELDAVNIT